MVIGYWLLVSGYWLLCFFLEDVIIVQCSTFKCMVRSVDSIGANIAEGNGRYNYNDNQRFIKIARGSLHETRHWLRLACARHLLTTEQIERIKPLIDELSPKLNAYLNSIQSKANTQALKFKKIPKNHPPTDS